MATPHRASRLCATENHRHTLSLSKSTLSLFIKFPPHSRPISVPLFLPLSGPLHFPRRDFVSLSLPSESLSPFSLRSHLLLFTSSLSVHSVDVAPLTLPALSRSSARGLTGPLSLSFGSKPNPITSLSPSLAVPSRRAPSHPCDRCAAPYL
jgi:hypothetical protein